MVVVGLSEFTFRDRADYVSIARRNRAGARWRTPSHSFVAAMSLLRAAAARPRQALLASLPRRHASSAHDEHHDHHHYEDNTVYPKEGTLAPTLQSLSPKRVDKNRLRP